ncbi:hypothetical protein UT300005_37470 [Clostridium sp. CTA-5]
MKKNLLYLILSISIFSFMGCSAKKQPSSENKQSQNYSATNSLNKDVISPFILTDSTSLNCPFVFNDTTLVFPNPDENNRISMIKDPLPKDILKSENLSDFVNYSTNNLALINGLLYFADGSSGNSLASLNLTDKTYTKLNEDSVNNLIASTEDLFYINKNDNNKMYKYNITNKNSSALSLDSVGSFVLNGDFIIYQNLSDSSKIYSIKSDGTNRQKLTDYTANSFMPFNGSLLFFNTSDNNTLYSLDITTLESKRISLVKGEKLKGIGTQLFFINNEDSNYLYSLSVDLNKPEVTYKPYISDSINEYYLTPSGVFYEKSININNVYFSAFSQK